MEGKDNTHNGHRARMQEKFSKNPKGFLEHELLEMALFPLLPRINTNEIAHKLIRIFGSIEKVFSAKVEELTTIKGIGKKTATQIKLLGCIYDEIISRRTNVKTGKNLFNAFLLVEEIRRSFDERSKEKSLVILMDKKHDILLKMFFSDKESSQVSADIPEIINALALYKPAYMVLAHNHPSQQKQPSIEDDLTTKKMSFLCSLHGVKLLDHIIIIDEDYFSYHTSNRLEKIKSSAQLDKVIEVISENETLD